MFVITDDGGREGGVRHAPIVGIQGHRDIPRVARIYRPWNDLANMALAIAHRQAGGPEHDIDADIFWGTVMGYWRRAYGMMGGNGALGIAGDFEAVRAHWESMNHYVREAWGLMARAYIFYKEAEERMQKRWNRRL